MDFDKIIFTRNKNISNNAAIDNLFRTTPKRLHMMS